MLKKLNFFALVLMGAGSGVYAEEVVEPEPLPPLKPGEIRKAEDTRWTFETTRSPGLQKLLDDQEAAKAAEATAAGKKKKKKRKKNPKPPILIWLPEGEATKQVRAVFLVVANSDSKSVAQHPGVREVAKKHGMAIVYFRLPLQNSLDLMPEVLDFVGKQTKIAEFTHAPWITLGKSSMGKFAYYPAWKYPERTLATISYHAETPTWPMEDWSNLKDETILHVSLNGQTEWAGTYHLHVRPALLNYRLKTGVLSSMAVIHGVGHGNYADVNGSEGWGKEHPGQISCLEGWDYLAVHMDRALSLRLPEGYPTDAPFKLKQIDPNSGYLIDRFAIEDSFQKPREKLVQTEDGSYVRGEFDNQAPNGLSSIAPAEGFEVPEGVPVVDWKPKMGPQDWLITKGMGGFVMDADPVTDSEQFSDWRPTEGKVFNVEGKDFTFTRITEKEIGRRKDGYGGFSTKGGLQESKDRKLSAFGYTVLRIKEAGHYNVIMPHSMAVRNKMILNGEVVDHREIVELKPGLYPMMIVMRMNGTTWGNVEPYLSKASDELVAKAKESQEEKAEMEAALKKRFFNGPLDPWTFVRPAKDVPEAERGHMMWVADKEQAEAWIRLHDVERLKAEKLAAGGS